MTKASPKLRVATYCTWASNLFFADRYVYNTWGRDRTLAHDSYTCNKYPGSIGFPTPRKDENGNFVGAYSGREQRIEFAKENECPLKCRRKKEWKYC